MNLAINADRPELCWFQDVDKSALALVGGKVSSLGELIHAGVRVPPGFALTTAGFHRFLREGGIERALFAPIANVDPADIAALEVRSLALREMIESTPFSSEFEDQICEFYRKLSLVCCLPATPVAVRSSATSEDLPGASFAGQQDTYLWIRGVDDLLSHIRRCIGSLFTARAISYRTRMGFDGEQIAISVGVQKMANSYTAGVMFTLDPANGDRSVIAIDSNFGFGESVVSGEVTPDHFLVNKIALDIIERTISRKELCYTVDLRTQTSQAQEIPFERQTVQSILDEEAIELARMGKQIEKHYGRPMDIEWAIDKDLPAGGNIFILQARPETVWSSKAASATAGPVSALDHILQGMLAGRRIS
jgi:pyruvate,water dikinase